MKLALVAVLAAMLVLPGGIRHVEVNEGIPISVYALEDGGAAVVLLLECINPGVGPIYHLKFAYISGDNAIPVVNEEPISYCSDLGRIMVDAHGQDVHVVMECINVVSEVHYYHWKLPDGKQVASGSNHRAFMPLVE